MNFDCNFGIFSKDNGLKTFCFLVFLTKVRGRLQKMGALASMNIFLRQEIDRMQRVITLVRSTLTDLQLAIEGTIIMSEVLKNDYFQLGLQNLTKKPLL